MAKSGSGRKKGGVKRWGKNETALKITVGDFRVILL